MADRLPRPPPPPLFHTSYCITGSDPSVYFFSSFCQQTSQYMFHMYAYTLGCKGNTLALKQGLEDVLSVYVSGGLTGCLLMLLHFMPFVEAMDRCSQSKLIKIIGIQVSFCITNSKKMERHSRKI